MTMKRKLLFTSLLLLLTTVRICAQSDWKKPTVFILNGKDADIVYRYGDVDNLNQGWSPGYNPFTGKTTYPHRFPFKPTAADPAGTDRIMVASGFKNTSSNTDGYTSSTKRPANLPVPLLLKWPPSGIEVSKAVLQIFLDDFQPGIFAKNYFVYIDNERIPYLEYLINNLSQSGPVGKLVTIDILPQYLKFFEDGEVKILIDDAYTRNGDGYAIDFIQLLINPKIPAKGIVKGKVVNYKNDEPIANALVTASNGAQAYTDMNGQFRLTGITAGLAVIHAGKSGFKIAFATKDVTDKDTSDFIKLELRPEEITDAGALERIIREKGQLELRTIFFDVNSSTIKPAAEPQLKELAIMLNKNAGMKLELSGHTDNAGTDAGNLQLSRQRAEAVLAWLHKNGTDISGIVPQGYGAAKPVADNNTEEGRELNRRVEIRVINEKL